MITIPKLFYLGLLAGLINRIPGMDYGTLLFAFSLNQFLFLKSFNRSLISVGMIVLGYAITQLLPLWKLDIFFYSHSDSILSFIFGIVLFSAYHFWMEIKNRQKLKTLLQAILVLVLGILLKAWKSKILIPIKIVNSFFQGLLILIPAFEIKQQLVWWQSPINAIFCMFGLLIAIYGLRKIEFSKRDWSWVKVSLLVVALCDYWPWRSFQKYVYIGEGAKWLNDYPVYHTLNFTDIVFALFFCFLGLLCSWSILKIRPES